MLGDYVVVDLEMTGLAAGRDKILEIGALRVKNHQKEAEYQVLVNPHLKLQKEVAELTGITQEMAESGEEEQKATAGFLEFSQGLPLVGHNIIFDFSFLKQSAVNHGLEFEALGLDTLKLSRKLLPNLEKKTLDYLCEYFNIQRSQKHRALEDARATETVLKQLWEEFGVKEPRLFEPKPLQYRVKKQGPITPRQKKYLKELADYHKIELTAQLAYMTRNQASRLTDQILSQYGRIKGD